MRTTVELPAELMRRAKAQAAARGESLKKFFERAIAAEVGSAHHRAGIQTRVKVPLFGDPNGPRIGVTHEDIERVLAEEEAEAARRFMRKAKK